MLTRSSESLSLQGKLLIDTQDLLHRTEYLATIVSAVADVEARRCKFSFVLGLWCETHMKISLESDLGLTSHLKSSIYL